MELRIKIEIEEDTAHVCMTQLRIVSTVRAMLIIFYLSQFGKQLFRLLLLLTGHDTNKKRLEMKIKNDNFWHGIQIKQTMNYDF